MNFSGSVWKQLKNKSVNKYVSALLKDGFVLDEKIKTERIYRHPDGRRVSIHYHTSNATFRPGLLKALLKDIGWTEDDLIRLKLIK